MVTAICMVSVYSIFVLGGCSPVHFRSASAGVGLLCILLATVSGYSISFYFGYLITHIHNILPFMVLGIGVDDMFVIVNTID